MTNKEAIEEIKQYYRVMSQCLTKEDCLRNNEAISMAIEALSADGDTISRQDAIEAVDEQIKYCDKALASFDISLKDEYAVKVEKASLNAFRETLKYLPSAQPSLDEWCTDCKEYDHEKHCCPRWNRVIRTTLEDVQTERKTDIIQKFHDYQVEWLTSHCDLELEPVLESWVVRFLNDTANCYMMEVEHD